MYSKYCFLNYSYCYYLTVGCSSAGLAKPLSCVSEASSSSSSAWISFIFSLKAFLDVFELLQAHKHASKAMARRTHEDPPRKNKFARERRDIAHLCSMYRFLNKCIFFPYLPLDFTCDFLSLLADVFDEAFEGAGFDSTVPPFFGPWKEDKSYSVKINIKSWHIITTTTTDKKPERNKTNQKCSIK